MFGSAVPWYSIPAAVALSIVGLILYDYVLRLRLPPGPTPLPFIGNTHQIPKAAPWNQFIKWTQTYGDPFTIWYGRRPVIVISDPYIVVDLMEKRSQKYSSRPRSVVLGEIYWESASIAVQPYGKAWSIRRKLLHQVMAPSALRLYKPQQLAEASRLCAHLQENPQEFIKHIERFTAGIVLSIAYGRRVDSCDAEIVRKRLVTPKVVWVRADDPRLDFIRYAGVLSAPGKFMAESLPALKHLPLWLAPWKREIQQKGLAEAEMNKGLVQMDSLCKMMLEIREEQRIPLDDRSFAHVPGSMFAAGSDTTSSTLCSAVLALITHPSALEMAHVELDTVVGDARTPTFDDEAHLPYIKALIKEVLRWRPVAVLGGIPHATSEDDQYRGWHIPKGTTIMGNLWAINNDERYYPDPQLFDPIRFLEGDEPPEYLSSAGVVEQMHRLRGVRHPSQSGHSCFGWGRRYCPGADLALNSLFAALSKILWAFDVLPVEGVTYDTFDYTEGISVRPRPFRCRIQARSAHHAEIIKREFKDAEKWLTREFPLFEE
ncbi:MAG: hypothetical protein M1822_002416 [Bathelium mastoideum]|nr:MAG: hypothetical protein M1822_002416 [Bathelium mastoideum]